MKKNKQLGQGLGALLTPSKNNPEDFNQSSILLSKIKPNPNQPRKNFADKSLKQLAQSIDEKGLISPITVKKVDNKYIIVAGERRYRAHKLLNKKRIFSILLVIISILIMIFLNIKTLPWVGIIVALSWAFYNLVRKKINIETDIGLLIESLYIFPFALIAFYFIFDKGLNDFSLANPGLSMFLLLAGPMTVIPLFLYVRGVELIGLGATGMIFYITPTLQFLLGFFYYDEVFSFNKLVSFIIIWVAVIIYLRDLYETN